MKKRTEIEVELHELEARRKEIFNKAGECNELTAREMELNNIPEYHKYSNPMLVYRMSYSFIDGQINALEWLLGRNEKLYNVKD